MMALPNYTLGQPPTECSLHPHPPTECSLHPRAALAAVVASVRSVLLAMIMFNLHTCIYTAAAKPDCSLGGD